MKDEGIVQAFSKEKEQLSRRLHQKCRFPGEIRGACFSRAPYDATWSKDGTPNNLKHYERLTPRNGKYSASQLADRRVFESDFLSITPRG